MTNFIESPSKIIKMKTKRDNNELTNNNLDTKESFYCDLYNSSPFCDKGATSNSDVSVKKIRIDEGFKIANIKGQEKGQYQINFFDLNSSNTDDPDNISDKKLFDEGYNTNDIKFRLSENFIKIVLKNDLRVKMAKYINDLVFIYFFTLEDSISFYKQFYSYTELHFANPYDYEQIFLLTSPEWELVNLIGSGNDSYPINDEADSFKEFDKNDLLKIFNHQNNKPININGSIKIEYKEPEKTVDDSHLTIFKKKVEYFSNIKNFFGKNDLKVMMQSLEVGSTGFIFNNTKEIAVGARTNKVMQEAINILTEDDIAKIINNIGYDIAPIAATKHGAYTIQMLISASKTYKTQLLLSKYFSEFGKYLIAHEIGNYAIQKLLKFDVDLVFNFFLNNINDIVNKDLGMKVFKKCTEYFSDKKHIIMEKIEKSFL